MSRPILCAALLAGLMAAMVPSSSASTSVAGSQDLPRLVAAAERICEVEVLDAIPVMRPDGRVETRYSVATRTPIKGSMASFQEIRVPGGEVAGRGTVLPGMPRLRAGERHILFLSRESAGTGWRMPVGLRSGAVRVLPGTDGTAPRVLVPAGDAHEAPAAAGPRDYDVYLQEIFEEVERQSR